ncbi:hypothetical protein PALS2_271 [Staphylococcus phage PALS_2]|nr:hypothetical protein PALS2_271 [Staphylococcus phage PALS_2]
MLENKDYNNEFLKEEIEIVNESLKFNNELNTLNESPVKDFFQTVKEFFLNILSLIKNGLVKFMKFFNNNFNRVTIKTKSTLKKIKKNKEQINNVMSKLSGPASVFSIWKAANLRKYENTLNYAGHDSFSMKYYDFEKELEESDHYLEIPLTMSIDLDYIVNKSFEQFNEAKSFAKSFKISADTMKSASETSIKFANKEIEEEKIRENQRMVNDLNKLNVLYRKVINNAMKSHVDVLNDVQKYIG